MEAKVLRSKVCRPVLRLEFCGLRLRPCRLIGWLLLRFVVYGSKVLRRLSSTSTRLAVRRLGPRLGHSHSETQLTYTSRSSEQRELTTGLNVGAAYVKNIWLGFLLRLAVAIHHYLSRVIILFYLHTVFTRKIVEIPQRRSPFLSRASFILLLFFLRQIFTWTW